ncbi:MAG: cation:proton antiporter [Chloroflexi bacterium]|nr:cation:proton antiporter [Chloroflexota bacterium]
MHEAEIIELVLGLLVVVALAVTVSRRIGVPYPILLVGGIVIGVVPGMPHVDLPPDLVFLLFLPPILFAAGFFTSIRDFRANLRPPPAGGRAGRGHHFGRGPGHPWSRAEHGLGTRLRARRHRVAARCGRRDVDRPASWSAAPRGDRAGGRKPGQRRHGAGSPAVRCGRRPDPRLLAG